MYRGKLCRVITFASGGLKWGGLGPVAMPYRFAHGFVAKRSGIQGTGFGVTHLLATIAAMHLVLSALIVTI
jgi:hypothetical protein